jgi:hypothetical protein
MKKRGRSFPLGEGEEASGRKEKLQCPVPNRFRGYFCDEHKMAGVGVGGIGGRLIKGNTIVLFLDIVSTEYLNILSCITSQLITNITLLIPPFLFPLFPLESETGISRSIVT